ncbi:MAG: CaiB/BaiF CoA-transferase family protein [Verrucomicrobiia bacterium]|jgi:crotonobetainyl-CoA:carnitine CoA-transferase CaiB-like acyl-CoA transferase
MKPLDGIRVVDLSRILAGPYCSMLLSDFGADIVKIENPDKGDDTRAYGPPFLDGESVYFLSVNRGKKSLTLNLKTPEAREILTRLIQRSDVLLENFRRDFLPGIGFGYEDVAKLNPNIIYASVTGYGHTGPWANRPGYDLAVQGQGGIMSLTGDPNGAPYKTGTSLADITAGIYATLGILLALQARQRTGKGQKVDVSLLDGQVSFLTYQAGIYFGTGKSPTRKGNRHPTIVPYETFKACDRYFNLAVGNDRLWGQFCDLIGHADLKTHEKFATNPLRVSNHDDLYPILQKIFAEKTADEWLALFEKNGIPCGPIFTVGEVLEHPQVRAREMVVERPHPKLKSVKMTGVPLKLSATPGEAGSAPPLLGQHTEEVLSGLGYSAEEIAGLRKAGAI